MTWIRVVPSANIAALTLFCAFPAAAEPVLLNPAEIIAADDYPEASFHRGDEGVTTYTLTLGLDGRPSACEIVETSGHAELDETACRLLIERARFDTSIAPALHAVQTYTNTVGWALPLSEPRALVFGVTVQSALSGLDPARTKCSYSDGQWRIVASGSQCSRDLPTFSTTRNGAAITSNIFDQYLFEADQELNIDSAINVGILLIDNDYKQGVPYLEKASELGNAMASTTLCSLYSFAEFWKVVDVNLSKALQYCMMSYEQHYNPNVVAIADLIISNFEAAIDPDLVARVRSNLVMKEHTANAQLALEGKQVIRSKDYPKKENSNGIGGRTNTMIKISREGRVITCLIAESTYSYVLDQRACNRLKEAGVFTPAVIDGAPSDQWTSLGVTWKPASKRTPSTESILLRVLVGFVGGVIL
jgi:TonB family protein